MIMESPIRKYQKQKEYQRHKVLRRIKKRQQRKAEQMQKIAEKQLKRKLPKMDDGSEPKIEYVDQVRVNPITGEALMSDNTTGSIILPEVSVRPEPKLTKSAFDGYTQYLDDLVSFVPVVGDVNDGINAGIALKNRDYSQAALLGAGLFLPNALEKPLKFATKTGSRIFKNIADEAKDRFAKILYDINPPFGKPVVTENFSNVTPNIINTNNFIPIQPKYTDIVERSNLGKYLDEGVESTVFENIRFPNKVIKEKEGLQSVQNFEELEERIGKDLLQNKLPNTLPLKYEGYTHEPVQGAILKQHFDIFRPVYSQKRITPANKIADPWHTVRKEGSVWEPSNDWYRQLEYLGYNRTSDGFYKVSGFPYKIGDLGPSNVGFDDFGNMLIFDPLIHYKHGKEPIHINPANRGKFNALKRRTGKTTEQLTHSKNPLTRKRAIFAQNAKKWNHRK